MTSRNQTPAPAEAGLGSQLQKPVDRRLFLRYTGLTAAAAGLFLAGCDDDENNNTTTVSLGSGDVGVLNYAYALEQLEAAFYAQVIANPSFATAFTSADERAALTAIAKHEAIHRDFFKAAITAAAPTQIIGGLTPNFSTVNFASRDSVLQTAKTFEDLGVAAYNGAGQLIQNPTYLTIAGKIVSVEARHAAYIRDLLSNGSFADSTTVDANGLDKAMTVAQVLSAAQPFITERVNGDNVGK
ncbi:ferritin-like domain-containing protein [Hymenobacter gummosus]|uniref:Ferritin-like domain-containing protein n=1 Tax=Hymenobacter gummosus TaxID=1776032 RepID=A0A3S0JGJ7_9BACT|nr:ferritin-like domain-containing protein [Hymenobacter gummosus]RTQ49214.1 ferritin-like domain-containing protein [Hymenobacter gummosus]